MYLKKLFGFITCRSFEEYIPWPSLGGLSVRCPYHINYARQQCARRSQPEQDIQQVLLYLQTKSRLTILCYPNTPGKSQEYWPYCEELLHPQRSGLGPGPPQPCSCIWSPDREGA